MAEAEDILLMKRGVEALRTGHKWLAKRDQFPYSTNAGKRNPSETISLVASDSRHNSAFNEKLQNLSLQHVKPVLDFFPLLGVISILGIYSNVQVEPIHVLLMGISRRLKECLFNCLCDCSRARRLMCYASREQKPYDIIRRRVSELINNCWRDTELQSSGNGLKIDFSKGKYGGRLQACSLRQWSLVRLKQGTIIPSRWWNHF